MPEFRHRHCGHSYLVSLLFAAPIPTLVIFMKFLSLVLILVLFGLLYMCCPRYGNHQLVLYNVSCQPGQLSYFDLVELELEDANCFDPRLGKLR